MKNLLIALTLLSTTAFGGSADGYTARGWLAVVLEKNTEAV